MARDALRGFQAFVAMAEQHMASRALSAGAEDALDAIHVRRGGSPPPASSHPSLKQHSRRGRAAQRARLLLCGCCRNEPAASRPPAPSSCSASRRAAEYFQCIVSILEWARRSSGGEPAAQAAPYLGATVALQEAHLLHLRAIKMANLYKIAWVRAGPQAAGCAASALGWRPRLRAACSFVVFSFVVAFP